MSESAVHLVGVVHKSVEGEELIIFYAIDEWDNTGRNEALKVKRRRERELKKGEEVRMALWSMSLGFMEKGTRSHE